MSTKRPRLPSGSSSSSVSTQSPTPKTSRTTQEGATITHPLLCSLPPTCNHNPTPIANTKDLEIHYANYHAHVCEESGCRCVFPGARLLELHQTECHDPLAAVRKERGEKIFGCFLGTCPKKFSTPKARRLHLIQAHHYPKEYFFAVTNKGVGGLLKRWGEGASMIRGEWKQREGPQRNDESDDDEATHEEEMEDADVVQSSFNDIGFDTGSTPAKANAQDNLDGLADSMSSLSLVPSAIRFGRGGKKAGLAHGRAHDVDTVASARGQKRGRGGGRGGVNKLEKRGEIPNGQDHEHIDMGAAVNHSSGRGRDIHRGRGVINLRGLGGGRGRGRGRGRGTM